MCSEYIPTEQLREKLREYAEEQRKSGKNNSMDCVRLGLGEIQSMISDLENLTVRDVSGMCTRIKRKKHASHEDMFRLSHAFLQAHDNISEFVRNIGAINILVKMLTGHDSELQIRACETLCNLSLGQAYPCERIALYAGTYLVTYLGSTDLRLKLTSLWIVSHIAATSGKGLEILISLEVVPRLSYLWNKEQDEEVLNAMAIALDLIVSSGTLRFVDKLALRECFLRDSFKKPIGHYHLKYIFQSLIFPDVPLSGPEQEKVIDLCIAAITESDDPCRSGNLLKLLFSVRVLSNMISLYPGSTSLLVEKIKVSNISLVDTLNKLLNRDEIVKEVLWFIKNLICSENSDMQIYLQEDGVLQELKVGRFSVPESL